MLSLALFEAGSLASAQPFRIDRVNIGGGGKTSGLIIHPAVDDLVYAKSDTAGVFRWDPANNRWINLTEFLPAEAQSVKNADSIAVDPSAGSDTTRQNTIYAALGGYYSDKQTNQAYAGVYRSTDRGGSWSRIWGGVNIQLAHPSNPSVLLNQGSFAGQGLDRSSFVRLAVDPANPDVLYVATGNDGLYRSTNARASSPTFTKLANAPTGFISLPYPDYPRGITAVLIDTRAGTVNTSGITRSAKLYLALDRTKSTESPAFEGGIWQSLDGGETWTRLGPATNYGTSEAAGPVNPTRMAFGPGGSLLVSNREIATEKDWGVSLGGIYKWTPTTGSNGSWSRLPGTTGLTFKSIDTITDPTSGDWTRIIAASALVPSGAAGLLWRSTDGGANWTTKEWRNFSTPNANGITFNNDPGWILPGFQYPHGSEDAKLNRRPGRFGELWSADPFGISRTTDVWATTVAFDFLINDLENTVQWTLCAPPVGDIKLYSAGADVNGWGFTDTGKIPSTQLVKQVESDSSKRPGDAVFNDITYARSDPSRIAIVRSTLGGYYDDSYRAIYLRSSTGTWSKTAGQPGGTGHWGQPKIVFSATDPNRMVFVGSNRPPYYTVDGGANWTAGTGVTYVNTGGATVLNSVTSTFSYDNQRSLLEADPVDGLRFFYRLQNPNTKNINIYMTVNGGANWVRALDLSDDPNFLKANRSVMATVLNPTTNKAELWLAARTRGLYRCSDTSASNTTLSVSLVNNTAIKDAWAVTFGAPAPGSSNPTLYVAGRVAIGGTTKDGIFYSTNYGSSWTAMMPDGTSYIGGSLNYGEFVADQNEFGRVYFAVGGQGIIQTTALAQQVIASAVTSAPSTQFNYAYLSNSYNGVIRNSGSYLCFMLNNGQTADYTLNRAAEITEMDLALGTTGAAATGTRRFDVELRIDGTWIPVIQNLQGTFTNGAYTTFTIASPGKRKADAVRLRARENNFYIDEVRFRGF